jgi:hypothetical protein
MGQLVVAQNLWRNEDKEKAKKLIMDAIAQDAIIENKTNISVDFGDADKKELHLIGKVENDRSKERVRKIAQEYTPNDVEIHDELAVG